MHTFEQHSFTAPLPCRYLLHLPDAVNPEELADAFAVVTLHGYGSNPETMLRLTVPAVGPGVIVASVQAPFHYYLKMDAPGSDEGFNWGVRQRHAEAIGLHHDMVRTVLAELQARFGILASRCVLMGFSQPVGLNYRFIGTYPEAAGGVIGVCGGVPRDWEEGSYREVRAPILHISRDQDEVFPVETARGFAARLRHHAGDVESHLLAGGHRFPSKAGGIIQPWLARIGEAGTSPVQGG